MKHPDANKNVNNCILVLVVLIFAKQTEAASSAPKENKIVNGDFSLVDLHGLSYLYLINNVTGWNCSVKC